MFKCKFCGKEFPNRFKMNYHYKTRHKDAQQILCECGCEELAPAGYRYCAGHNMRLKSFHDTRKKKYGDKRKQEYITKGIHFIECTFCGRPHKRRDDLRLHIMKDHPGQWKQKCKCGCGEISPPGRDYINHHNARFPTSEARGNISLGQKRRQANMTSEQKAEVAEKSSSGLKKFYDEHPEIKIQKMKQYRRSSNYKTGDYYSTKMNRTFHYDSSYELIRFKQLDADPKVKTWEKNTTLMIPYIFKGRTHHYFPDLIIDDTTIEALNFIDDPLIKIKHAAAIDYCSKNNYLFSTVLESELGVIR